MDGPAEPTANRGVMHAVVNVSSAEYSGLVNFFVTHFGLNDRDQCRSVLTAYPEMRKQNRRAYGGTGRGEGSGVGVRQVRGAAAAAPQRP